MSPEDSKFFQGLIIQEKKEVLTSLGIQLEPHEPVFNGSHLPDHATDVMIHSITIQLNSREGRYLYHLEEALERIKNGTYGICRSCGNDIPRKRLEAVPHTTQCIHCKNKEERQKGIRGRREHVHRN